VTFGKRGTVTRAISVRQPFAELILQGKKKFEYRTQATNIRTEPDLLATGEIVGSVEITGASGTTKKTVLRIQSQSRRST